MERLEYENYEEFACDIADEYDSSEDEFSDIAIIAKYNEAKAIIKELLCLGYDIASIDIHREEFENYFDEYLISLNFDGVWCEKFKRDSGYFTDESKVIYIMDNCFSKVISYCESEELYEVSVDIENSYDNYSEEDTEDIETERTYMVNGKSVDKATFNKYVSKFAPDLVDGENDTLDNDDYSITVKCNLGAHEAIGIIKDMERRMMHIDDMFREIDYFRRLFNW